MLGIGQARKGQCRSVSSLLECTKGHTWLCGGTCRKQGANRSQDRVSKIIQELKCIQRWQRGCLAKQEGGFLKNHMTRDDNLIGRDIKTLVSFVVERVPKKDTKSGTWR